MKLAVLLGGLKNPQPAVRLDVVRVLGMLDEVRALETLRQMYENESDSAVRGAIAWAGKRLYQAQQAGYSTVDEVFRYFGIDREIENTPDIAEAEMLKRMENAFDSDMTRMQERAGRKRLGMAAAAGLGVGVVAGASMGLGAALGAMGGPSSASSSMDKRPQIGTSRTPATAPSKADFSVWLRRLREDASPGRREQAIIELKQINNPAALPHLAVLFVSDPSPKVRQAAQHFGKILYWSAVYWEMEQDGSLQQEMQRRAQAMGKSIMRTPTEQSSGPPAGSLPGGASAPPPGGPSRPQEPDAGKILRQAQSARRKRKNDKR
ncbi:MAG: HEAT repeat domain-containing protein [Anaerolineae bacterium]|nr:HEAT repeat domain-containing protein [Anaerolineae bacterium]